MEFRVLLVFFLCFLPSFIYRVEGRNLNVTKIEDLELKRQLNLLNKPAVKTIHAENGDIYDCVDFYKQPAFDHPLAKNYIPHLKMENHPLFNEAESGFFVDTGLSIGEGCPLGTVLIKRLTKEDLIREKDLNIRSKLTSSNNENVHFAVSRTLDNGSYSYAGAGAIFTIWNPQATTEQYSSSRLIIQKGRDSIQVGWRVDPFLTGDKKTHLYVYTDAVNSHCFGTKCTGFVVTSRKIAIDAGFSTISIKGGKIYDFQVDILRDWNGDWRLRAGPGDKIELGYWPAYIFSETGLTELADYIEWGGEVFSRPNIVKPQMGNGNFPVKDPEQSSSIKRVTYRNEEGNKMDAELVVPYEDSEDFKVIDVPKTSELAKHMVFFGGPGGKV